MFLHGAVRDDQALADGLFERPSATSSSTSRSRGDSDRSGTSCVAMIFAFTSIAVPNTLATFALRRGRELGLLRLVGATTARCGRWRAGRPG